jgi:hypothetical protein
LRLRKYWSEKIDSSISLIYQHTQKTERTVQQLGESPIDNKQANINNEQQTKEVTMKKTNFKFKFSAKWAVVLTISVAAGVAHDMCARSNISLHL